MRFTFTSILSYVHIHNGVATYIMWYGSHCRYGICLTPWAKQMILLYVVAILMAVLLFAWWIDMCMGVSSIESYRVHTLTLVRIRTHKYSAWDR